ncbi:MAG: ribosomal RNA adenine dimethylase domain-containing protein [Phycisphaerae bacterium]|nr:ribosomal RNA adenine dimethylase domain-containing protein [Phycisphaerae bacterium]
MASINFIKQFIIHPTQTGAIWPSSAELAQVITDAAGLAEASVIVEWGPGTGVFTEQILLKKPKDALFFAMELNPDFVRATQTRCPEAQIYHDSATETPKYLTQHHQSRCDAVICGLPWAAFDESLQDALLDTLLDILQPDARFLTFAYLQGLLLPAGRRFRKKLQSRFSHVTTTRTVWRNTPPAFVYVATK